MPYEFEGGSRITCFAPVSYTHLLYDSVLDRYSELMTFFGICYYLSMKDYFLYALIAFVALIGDRKSVV